MSQYSKFKFNNEGSRKLKAMIEPAESASRSREVAAKEDRRRINIMMDRRRDWNRDVRVSPPSPAFNRTTFPDTSPAGRKVERKNAAEGRMWEARIQRVQEVGQGVIDGKITSEDHSYLDLKQDNHYTVVETAGERSRLVVEDSQLQNLERACVLLQEDRTRVQYAISDELKSVLREWRCMQNCLPCLAGQPLPAPFAALLKHVGDGKHTKGANPSAFAREEGRHAMARDIDNKVLTALASSREDFADTETGEGLEMKEESKENESSFPLSPEETREEIGSPGGSAFSAPGLEELLHVSCSLTSSPKLSLARRAIARSRTPRPPSASRALFTP